MVFVKIVEFEVSLNEINKQIEDKLTKTNQEEFLSKIQEFLIVPGIPEQGIPFVSGVILQY